MIEILSCGALATVQDLGRFGHRRLGVGTAGAMDVLALQIGNLMLGNGPGDAAIEITASGMRVRLETDTAFALTGAEAVADLDGLAIPPWWAHAAKAGSELTIRSPKVGLRTYLALRGGIAVPEILGSRSTDLKSGFGGHEGRSLKAGDRLPCGLAEPLNLPYRGFGVKAPMQSLGPIGPEDEATVVRAIPAAQHESFTADARAAFWSAPWKLRPDSNRIGFRFEGPELVAGHRRELLSHGILPGVVQVPPGGQPIVQMRDGNTAGGYPKIAVVIEADLWRLAQIRLGGRVRFLEVDRDAGLAAEAEISGYLGRIKHDARLASGYRP
ncbi:biotin-dependent carboxyltransferase family protein (plasmid) [Bosea sp. F3-2]|uniref:5-oxoprolinase subunit C family protein n=1 Tax=Bosea sp. F3-2 TaxID=2599640 RepID=UPI0011EC5D85|nr:biotin-dependent carboxyltransferase family protein [Bosea sp. F3-2]QEL27364.1 biotin-dependent carboxyltransferase family protein [Bosea sp. F3-2]